MGKTLETIELEILAKKAGLPLGRACELAGLCYSSYGAWRRGVGPSLQSYVAVKQVLKERIAQHPPMNDLTRRLQVIKAILTLKEDDNVQA